MTLERIEEIIEESRAWLAGHGDVPEVRPAAEDYCNWLMANLPEDLIELALNRTLEVFRAYDMARFRMILKHAEAKKELMELEAAVLESVDSGSGDLRNLPPWHPDNI